MNLHYETNTRGSASEVIRPECGVDSCEPREKDKDKADGDERREEQEDSEGDKEEEAERGMRRVVKLQDPRRPTEEEVKEHELTHLPFRNWCKHCVAGKGTETPCRRSEGGGELPEFHIDWAFPGEAEANKTVTMLVVRMRDVRMTMSTLAPSKATGDFVAKRIVTFMKECGCEGADVIVKADQEPAIVLLFEKVAQERAANGGKGRTLIEHSPKYSSKSNGMVERAIRSVEEQMRTMRSAAEKRLGVRWEHDHCVWAWIAEYASFLLNRFEVGHDGKTAYERCKGKRAKVEGLEFLESVWWKRRVDEGGLGKLAVRWEEGVFLGCKATTGEKIIGTLDGVVRAR